MAKLLVVNYVLLILGAVVNILFLRARSVSVKEVLSLTNFFLIMLVSLRLQKAWRDSQGGSVCG